MSNYLVVGGSSGIGLEVVKQLVASGNQVTVLSRTNKNLEGFAGVQFHTADVTAEAKELPTLTDSFNGLLYAPGTINLKPFKSLKLEDFKTDFEVNVLGAVKVIQKYQTNLKSAGKSSIVMFSTVAVQTGMQYHASVASAKGAIEGLTRSLAAEFAPDIRVNSIAPSITHTPLAERLLNNEQKMQASIERHPLKKVGSAAEIASLAVYLLSDQAGFITGEIFKAAGGISSIRLL